jgi:hypothetical protein
MRRRSVCATSERPRRSPRRADSVRVSDDRDPLISQVPMAPTGRAKRKSAPAVDDPGRTRASSPKRSPAACARKGECDRPRESRFPRGGGRWLTMGRCSSCSESRRTRTSLRCCRSSSSARCLLLLCDSSVSASPERRSCGAGRPPRGRWEQTATLPITEVERSQVALGRMSACKSAVRCACLRPGVGPDPRRVDRAPPAVQVCLCA